MHSDELHDVYLSNIIRVIKSRRMSWVGNVACVGEGRYACKNLVRKSEGGNHLKYLVENWRMILKWFVNKSVGRVLAGWIWLRIRTSGKILGFCSGAVRK